MALRNILNKDDPMLHKKCRPVDNFDKKLSQLLDDMAQTNRHLDGAGLAAPQIGLLRRVAVVEWDNTYCELINPEVIEVKGTSRDIEGCLSCPNDWGYVVRPATVKFATYDREGNRREYFYRGHAARAVLHEIDHLDGIVFTDKADEMVDPKVVEERDKKRRKRMR
ncbi:MAG: peptide deformylase [Ruminococcus sp.]|jgi:peptide deformylase|nr:peptide deformylase [Ruminococcus sp.]MDR0986995.1 peptide deformylase [Ruminococcus sp.]